MWGAPCFRSDWDGWENDHLAIFLGNYGIGVPGKGEKLDGGSGQGKFGRKVQLLDRMYEDTLETLSYC